MSKGTLENWANQQIELGNLVEDGTGCVGKVLKEARRLDSLAAVTADDLWAVDTQEFEQLCEKYVGRVPWALL